MLESIPENVKSILTAFLPLLFIVILTYFVGSFGFSKISEARNNVAKAQRDQTVLQQKLSILGNVTGDLGNQAASVAVALPDTNPSVLVISQIRTLGSKNSVDISNLKSGGEVEDPSGLLRVDISFDATGGRIPVLNMIQALSGVAPISLVDKIKLTETNQVARASVTVKSFWAPLPTQLPALTEQINDLTDVEKKTLSDVATLSQPVFSVVPAAKTGGKANPFTQ